MFRLFSLGMIMLRMIRLILLVFGLDMMCMVLVLFFVVFEWYLNFVMVFCSSWCWIGLLLIIRILLLSVFMRCFCLLFVLGVLFWVILVVN